MGQKNSIIIGHNNHDKIQNNNFTLAHRFTGNKKEVKKNSKKNNLEKWDLFINCMEDVLIHMEMFHRGNSLIAINA